MVQKKMHQPEMRATYLFKPGQTFENTKVSNLMIFLLFKKLLSKNMHGEKLNISRVSITTESLDALSFQPSERTRALIMPRSTYQRFVDCVTEEDRMAAQQEQQAAKLAALKKATYEKSKTWDTKIEVSFCSVFNVLKKKKKKHIITIFHSTTIK